MITNTRRSGIFILGAGFSKPAGLPVAVELWDEIRRAARDIVPFKIDLESYIEFRHRCDGIHLDPQSVDFEDFMGFLDGEFYLGLRGSDTWSDEGNPTQLIVKKLIAKILLERTPAAAAIDGLYLRFADALQPGDLVLTFNYDNLLERALEAVGKPFRLFGQRFISIHGSYNVIDRSKDEVILLKLHGSVDWFHRGAYRQRDEARTQAGLGPPGDPVFNSDVASTQLLVEGPRNPDDPLLEMYRLLNVDEVFAKSAAL